MIKNIFKWLAGCTDYDKEKCCEPIVKTVGTVIECNASECMDNFEGQCILTNISLTKEKLSGKNAFTCSEYSTEDLELKNDFNKEVGGIYGCN